MADAEAQTQEPVPESIPLDPEGSGWKEHLEELLEQRRHQELQAFMREVRPSDIADFLEGFDEVERGLFTFKQLAPDTRGEVLYEMQDELRLKYLSELLRPKEIATIVQNLQSDRAADVLADLKLERISKILSRIPHEGRSRITELLSYPENTAGAIMAKEFVAVEENHTVKQAISTIRKFSRVADDIHKVYVLDEAGRYKGHVSLKRLILSRPQTRVKRIMEQELLPIPVYTDREEVAKFFTRYDFITAPVVDGRGVMLGRITVDDILEVVEEEASEDILRMGGVSGEETLTTPLYKKSLQRVVWLVVNLVTAFVAAGVIKQFEATIANTVVLAALMPIVAGMGGNAATQTMALVIRNIALGELTEANRGRTLLTEITIGIINGVSIGILTGFAVFVLTGEWVLGFIIFGALVVNLIVAATAGTLVPILLRSLKIDPAIGSGIVVTTCTDVMGFLVFLGLAHVGIELLGL
ncbi:MAG: magnesium transporter [Spirochaetales bacterium]|nr:magnesium transporter [Leptospiraceae bacterium]MCP5483582.1 magnesium transporter [Spirochaetales bacterium]MCP5486436.1 magnesium transporter [Spirochaetales bacterium]